MLNRFWEPCLVCNEVFTNYTMKINGICFLFNTQVEYVESRNARRVELFLSVSQVKKNVLLWK